MFLTLLVLALSKTSSQLQQSNQITPGGTNVVRLLLTPQKVQLVPNQPTTNDLETSETKHSKRASYSGWKYGQGSTYNSPDYGNYGQYGGVGGQYGGLGGQYGGLGSAIGGFLQGNWKNQGASSGNLYGVSGWNSGSSSSYGNYGNYGGGSDGNYGSYGGRPGWKG